MNSHDKELMDKIMKDKERYGIHVDNDVVWVQDNELDSSDKNFWIGFYEYGDDLLKSLFEYIGFKSEYV
ncbi:hypothetical protein BSK59_13490 [Paenibacillus odorifer]|uniref:hypothetical protein n=1 Tax=Paenibacillus odorifer TaxID=189426 RepID=UPI0009700EBE|nr:hypothetical protein [Paenibacillus odorifer]OME55484.1 hypothetical protein BSK59_13490 [Paenibacillus odorifer]